MGVGGLTNEERSKSSLAKWRPREDKRIWVSASYKFQGWRGAAFFRVAQVEERAMGGKERKCKLRLRNPVVLQRNLFHLVSWEWGWSPAFKTRPDRAGRPDCTVLRWPLWMDKVTQSIFFPVSTIYTSTLEVAGWLVGWHQFWESLGTNNKWLHLIHSPSNSGRWQRGKSHRAASCVPPRFWVHGISWVSIEAADPMRRCR